MPIGCDQQSALPSQALYLCLKDLVDSMQEEMDLEAAAATSAQYLPKSLPTNSELWWRKDVDAFVEALHSIRNKAPNRGFKSTHF